MISAWHRRNVRVGGWIASVALALVASVATAQETLRSACLDGRLYVIDSLDEAWTASLHETCDRLRGASDVDTSVELRISRDGSAVVIVAMLADGRFTTRRVEAPENLPSTIEALVLLPRPRVTSEAILRVDSDRSSAPLDVVAAATVIAPPVEAATETSAPTPSSVPVTSVRLELGATTGGRVFGLPPYAGINVTGYAGLRIAEWGLALIARWDPLIRPFDVDASHFEMSGFSLGFAVNHRWRAGRAFDVDVGGSASIVDQTQSYDRAAAHVVRSETDARLGSTVRLLVGRQAWRWLALVEADVSPERARHPTRLESGLPRLPSWSVGVSTGIAWSP